MAAQLRVFSGKNWGNAAVPVLPNRIHHKADRFIDAGKQSNIPCVSLCNPDCSLTSRDNAPAKSEIDNQVVFSGTQQHLRFQNSLGVTRFPKSCGGLTQQIVLCRMNEPAFRQVVNHFLPSFCFCLNGNFSGTQAKTDFIPSYFQCQVALSICRDRKNYFCFPTFSRKTAENLAQGRENLV